MIASSNNNIPINSNPSMNIFNSFLFKFFLLHENQKKENHLVLKKKRGNAIAALPLVARYFPQSFLTRGAYSNFLLYCSPTLRLKPIGALLTAHQRRSWLPCILTSSVPVGDFGTIKTTRHPLHACVMLSSIIWLSL